MTLTWPASRNSFHPAWLLLPVPPLIGFMLDAFSETTPLRLALALRLVLAGLLVIPVVWWRAGEAGERALRLLKELRVQLPGCLLAMGLPGMLALGSDPQMVGGIGFAFGFGCLLMGAAAFGSEFEQRTLAGLLAQPRSRAGIFAEKTVLLAVLLLLATANLLLVLAPIQEFNVSLTVGAEMASVALFALCGGPLYSLLSRSTLAGLIFNLAVPPILYLVSVLVLQIGYRLGHPGEWVPEAWIDWLLTLGGPAYLLTVFALGWTYFHQLQLRDGGTGGRTDSGLHPLSRPVDVLVSRILPATGGLASLVRKELRLHVLPWLIASLMVGLWLLWLGLRQFTSDEDLQSTLNQVSALALFAGVLGMLVLLGTGAACIAEERALGTLEWQLTQPASLSRQWRVKVGVTVALGLILGVLLPAFLLLLGFGRGVFLEGRDDLPAVVVLAWLGIILLLLAVSIYASSVSRNTMKAAATAVGLIAGLVGTVALCGSTASLWINETLVSARAGWESGNALEAPAWAPSQHFLIWSAGVFVGGTMVLLLALLLGLASSNFRRLLVPAPRVFNQLLGLGLGLLAVLAAGGLALARLTTLAEQASWVETERGSRAALIAELGSHARAGRLAPGLYQQFGVPTNSPPAALAEAIISARGPAALREVVFLFRPHPAGTLNPYLAERYGLGTLPATTNVPAVDPTPPTLTPMSPEMRRRYGLEPAPTPRR